MMREGSRSAYRPDKRWFFNLALLVIVSVSLSAGSDAARPSEIDQEHAAKGLVTGKRYLGSGKVGSAIRTFKTVVKRYPKTSAAAEAQWEIAGMYARNREFSNAFDAYQKLFNEFPDSQLHMRAVEKQMEMVRGILSAHRRKDTSGPRASDALLPPRSEVKAMLRLILRNGVGSAVAPEAQFELGVVLEELGSPKTAKKAHETFVDHYPDHALADDAAFQIAYIDFKRVRDGEINRIEWTSLELADFLMRYPDSPKVLQARHLLRQMVTFETQHWIEMAEFYEKAGKVEAAEVYRRRISERFPAAAQE